MYGCWFVCLFLFCLFVCLVVCLFVCCLFVCLFVCYAFIYIQIGVESLPPLCIKTLCLCRNSPTWRGLSHLLRPLQVRWCRDAVRMLRICPSWNEGWSTLSEGELRLNSCWILDLLDSTNIGKMVPATSVWKMRVFAWIVSTLGAIKRRLLVGDCSFCIELQEFSDNALQCYSLSMLTPWKFNGAPGNRHSQKETHLPTIIFRGYVKLPGCDTTFVWPLIL